MNPTSRLTVNFTPVSPAPSLGYMVEYRQVGTTDYIQLSPNPTTSPINITSIVSGVAYEGYITSSCNPGSISNSVYFNTNNNGQIKFSNNVSGVSFNSAQLSGSSSFYYNATGTFPIANGNSITAVHTAFTGTIGVSITGTANIPSRINLSVNSDIIQTITYNGPASYSFDNTSFNGNDLILISIDSGTV